MSLRSYYNDLVYSQFSKYETTSVYDERKKLENLPSYFSRVYTPNFNINQLLNFKTKLPYMSVIRSFMKNQDDGSFEKGFDELEKELILKNIINECPDTKSYNLMKKHSMQQIGIDKEENVPNIEKYLAEFLTQYPQNSIIVFEDLYIMGKEDATIVYKSDYANKELNVFEQGYKRMCYTYALLCLIETYIQLIQTVGNRLSYDINPCPYFKTCEVNIFKYKQEVAQMIGNMYPIIGDSLTLEFALQSLHNKSNTKLFDLKTIDFAEELRKVNRST